MRMKTFSRGLLSLGMSFGLLASSIAWNGPGHMSVAALAYDELSPPQQARLANILRELPDLEPIRHGFTSGAFTDRELVMAAATWPDLIKQLRRTQRNTPVFGQYLDNGYKENIGALVDIDYSDLMHKGWHFVDLPIWLGPGTAPAHLPEPEPVNAVSVVDSLMGSLKRREPDARRAYQIVWLLHLVGDLHQPLHSANGCTPTYPRGDTGGNSVLIVAEKKLDSAGRPIAIPEAKGETELHAFWDDVLGKKAKGLHLDQDIKTADAIEKEALKIALPRRANALNRQRWVDESYALAKGTVYSLANFGPVMVEKKTKTSTGQIVVKRVKAIRGTVTKDYADRAHQTALVQVRIAGHRLARLLKAFLY
jgi:hypothetical protein